MKVVKLVVMLFVFVFFASGLSLISHAAEDRQKAPAAKSAPRGGGHQNIQGERRGAEQQMGRPQGNIQRERRGAEQHRGEHARRPGFTGERRVERPYPGVTRHVEHYNFRGRHYHTFSVHERTVWHRGTWRHTGHGWFWVVGGAYYAYPAPIYPYPLSVSETIFEYPVVAPAPVVIVRPPLVVQPQAQYWYYCDNPAGYSPYIENCNVEWRRVPAPPPQAPPPPK